VGPFSPATRNGRFVIVATDYFTKWEEAKALVNILDVDVKKFVKVPDTLISVNEL